MGNEHANNSQENIRDLQVMTGAHEDDKGARKTSSSGFVSQAEFRARDGDFRVDVKSLRGGEKKGGKIQIFSVEEREKR